MKSSLGFHFANIDPHTIFVLENVIKVRSGAVVVVATKQVNVILTPSIILGRGPTSLHFMSDIGEYVISSVEFK